MPRTLIVETHRRTLRVSIPDEAKVTFSTINPQARGGEYALRIKGKGDDQLAVICGVQSFRDEGQVTVQHKVKKTDKKARSKSDGKGSHETEAQYNSTVVWVEDEDFEGDGSPF